MLKYMLTLVVVVGGCLAADRCCFYSKFSGKLLMKSAIQVNGSDPNVFQQTVDIDYDYNRGLIKTVSRGHSLTMENVSFVSTDYSDYHHHRAYTIREDGVCESEPLMETQNTPCIPDGFTSTLSAVIGTPPNSMKLTYWAGTLNGAHVTYSVTDDCTPVTMEVVGGNADTRYLNTYIFADIKPDMLSSDNALDLPTACTHAGPPVGK
ncbi:uncharacterized protein LOC128227810 [Mya arenaria]|uniref:uncharacterized protein LOC128227810 n=1 Tax=Mya arenaria TaxID=6604 RepID=UPI0022E8A685|nr:uncharacterized protein LOC128227810 [Mya arenaria]